VASIRGWWRFEGRQLYPDADTLLITADGGGSNGSRLRLWKVEVQAFADESGLALSICHFPPGASKWNKIEHRLFSFISSNWRGEPLRDYQTITASAVMSRRYCGRRLSDFLRNKRPQSCQAGRHDWPN
jgi:Rhodopirellula transposase DDE domain